MFCVFVQVHERRWVRDAKVKAGAIRAPRPREQSESSLDDELDVLMNIMRAQRA